MRVVGVLVFIGLLALYLRVPPRPMVVADVEPAPSFAAPRSVQVVAPAVVAVENLAERALDANVSGEARWTALFDLTSHRPADVAAIARVATEPYDIENPRAQFEIRVRLHAIEALDRLGEEGRDVQSALVALANADGDENLKMFATIALAGLEEGRPGKLNRFLTEMMNQEFHD